MGCIYVENCGGAAIGTLAAVPVVIAVLAGIVGNMVTMLAAVALADRLRRRRTDGPQARGPVGPWARGPVGQTLLPSQITSMAMVGFGADTRTVVLWQTISIVVWGTVFGILAAVGLYAVA